MRLYGFISIMWIMMLSGGAIAILVLGLFPLDSGHDITQYIIRAVLAVLLLAAWVYALFAVKNLVFKVE